MEREDSPDSPKIDGSTVVVPASGPEPGAPAPPPFNPHDELIGDMQQRPRWMREQEKLKREARARARAEKWHRRLLRFRRRQHSA